MVKNVVVVKTAAAARSKMDQIFEAFHVVHDQKYNHFSLELIEINTKENLKNMIEEFECSNKGHFWIYPRDERMHFIDHTFINTVQSWDEAPITQ